MLVEHAYRIVTPRLELRCWSPSEAESLYRELRRSADHLRPWMPWVREDATLDDEIALLKRFRASFDRGEDFAYGIWLAGTKQLIGGAGLHGRLGKGVLEIGYWIAVGHTGNGFATEAAGALTRVAFEVAAIDRVEIRCDVANGKSAAIPRRLGYVYDGSLRRRLPGPVGRVDALVWSIFADEYPGSPATQLALEAYDAAERPIELARQ